ncbi:yqjZ [Symbiodinium necroappetens]|uniref:YqjZ protein n=1 Tax=Symbiodinium necroappetens TaxID=1628268 RepID=A0A812K4U2_9DINO|nr:yqjZ [Symbiodinium necroappetens]
MDDLAATMPGYLGVETVRGADGVGINVSYWATMADVVHWKKIAEHDAAQKRGKEAYYEWYRVRVAKVERAYAFTRGEA